MRWRRFRRSEAALLLTAALVGGCTAAVDAPAPARTPEPEAPFLVDPLRGYPLGVSVDERLSLSGAHQALVERREAAVTRGAAAELLERNPELHPARLLLAQADLAAGEDAAALEAGRRLVEQVEGYFAARLLVARAAENVGDLALAYDGYFDLAERSAAARERAAEIRPRALEILANRCRNALDRSRLDDAGAAVKLLAKWAPGESVTLFAALDLAAAVGDREAELAALRRLEPRYPENLELRAARADLELEVGEPSVGLRIYQDLATDDPGNPEVANQLARAKFLWRLTLLPAEVQRLARQPQLSRADFATILYWLFPQVRYGHSDSGTIATDVLDHERRAEIVRVVNLGLLSVDPTVHTYRPDDPQTRVEALAGMLRLLGRQEPRVACLGAEGPLGGLNVGRTCGVARRCDLIAEEWECLPAAALSGAEAFEMSRAALGQLGIE